MALNINKGNRRFLSEQDKDFLVKAVSLSNMISACVVEKAHLLKLRPIASINHLTVLTDVLIESSWGTHPLSQSHYKKKYSNNLALLQVDPLWDGKSQKHEDHNYKSYKDWDHFAADYSDYIIFSKRDIIYTESIVDQIAIIAENKSEPIAHRVKSLSLIEYYDLAKI